LIVRFRTNDIAACWFSSEVMNLIPINERLFITEHAFVIWQ
jgi:hypothetical protein